MTPSANALATSAARPGVPGGASLVPRHLFSKYHRDTKGSFAAAAVNSSRTPCDLSFGSVDSDGVSLAESRSWTGVAGASSALMS